MVLRETMTLFHASYTFLRDNIQCSSTELPHDFVKVLRGTESSNFFLVRQRNVSVFKRSRCFMLRYTE